MSDTVVVVSTPERLDEGIVSVSCSEHSVLDGLEDNIKTLINAARASTAKASDFLSPCAKDEDVALADLLADFDVCTIESADDETTVHDKLHVACSRSLCSCCADVLREIRCRDDFFSKRDAVVGDEDDLEQVADDRISIDDIGNSVDETDDELCSLISSSSLTGKDADLGDDSLALFRRHLADGEIAVDNAEDVEELALVFVDTLNLDIKEGLRVDLDLALKDLVYTIAEDALVAELCVVEGLEEVVRDDALGERLEKVQVADPFVGLESSGEDCAEGRIALEEPAAWCNTVCDVDELVGPELSELVEGRVAEDLGVDGSNTVNLVAADNGEIGHADALGESLFDDRHAGDLLVVEATTSVLVDLSASHVEEGEVDVVDDLEVAGKEVFEHSDRPGLEGLREDGVVSVGECAAADIESLFV